MHMGTLARNAACCKRGEEKAVGDHEPHPGTGPRSGYFMNGKLFWKYPLRCRRIGKPAEAAGLTFHVVSVMLGLVFGMTMTVDFAGHQI